TGGSPGRPPFGAASAGPSRPYVTAGQWQAGVSAQPQGGAGDYDRGGGRDRGDQPGRGGRVVGLWRGGQGRGGRDGGHGAGGGRGRGAGRYAQPGQGGGQLR